MSAAESRHAPSKWTGNLIVQRAVFRERPFGRDKRAQLVALAIGYHMGPNHEAIVGVPTLMQELELGRQAVIDGLEVASGAAGLFDSVRRGPGKCNRYVLKSSIVARASALMSGNPDTMKAGKPDFKGPKKAGFSDFKPGNDVRLSPPLMSGNSHSERSLNGEGARAWLSDAEDMWSERVGDPAYVRVDLARLASPSRPPDLILAGLRMYLAQANPATARPRDFARTVARWTSRAATARREDTPPTEHPQAAAKWRELLAVVKADPTLSERNYQTYALTARAVGLDGEQLKLWSPSGDMAKFLQSYADRAAAAFGLVVLIDWPGRTSVAA